MLLISSSGVIVRTLASLFGQVLPTINVISSTADNIRTLGLLASGTSRCTLMLLSVSLRNVRNPRIYHHVQLVSYSAPVLNVADFDLGQCHIPLTTTNTRKLINGNSRARLRRTISHILSKYFLPNFRAPVTTCTELGYSTQTRSALAGARRAVVGLYTGRCLASNRVTRQLNVSVTAIHGRVRGVIGQLGYHARQRTVVA